jgi:membrane associated rhomboid family serine protease
MHDGFGHLFFNLFTLWMFGSMLENLWGPKKFLGYYLISGIGAGLFHLAYTWLGIYVFPELRGGGILVGASGAVYGLLVAYAFLFPDNYIYIYFFLPLKAKYFAMILMAFDLISGIFYSQSSNVAHFDHIGGAVTGFILLTVWKKRGKLWGSRF